MSLWTQQNHERRRTRSHPGSAPGRRRHVDIARPPPAPAPRRAPAASGSTDTCVSTCGRISDGLELGHLSVSETRTCSAPGNTAFGRGGRKWRISCPRRGRRAFEPSGCRLCRSRSQVVIEILLTSPAPSRAAGCSCPVRCVLFPVTFSKYE